MPPAIAIVGVACEIPSDNAQKSTNLDFKEFGRFLERGGCSIEKIPNDRFALQGKCGDGSGLASSDRASILTGFDEFDHRTFGIPLAEARRMTPQTRKLIEVTYRALQDSSITTKRTGVFVGGSQAPQKQLHEAEFCADTHYQTGRVDCMLANRISHAFKLQGPSLNTDTACSASATALHLAAAALHRGECDAAIVASANHLATVEDHIGFSQLTVLSPDGQCKALADDANGYVRGEAVVSIVLKPLEAALNDGDSIYAEILGSAINSNGGQGAGLTSPSASSLRSCICEAWKQAQQEPSDAHYVEMHATGTTVGDRIEGSTLDVFGGTEQRSQPLIVGSVKSNVGHTEFAAFLVSLLKALHILAAKKTFAQISIARPSTAIDWKGVNARIASGEDLRGAAKRVLMGITSSGFGGSNAHVVVGEHISEVLHPARDSKNGISSDERPQQRQELFLVSSLTEATTLQLCTELANCPIDRPRSAALTLARRARQNPWATFGVGHSLDQCLTEAQRPRARSEREPKIAFLFPGQGAQHLHMARSLYHRFAVFRRSVQHADRVYRNVVGKSLIEDEGLFGETQGRLWSCDARWSTIEILPSLTMVQIGLVDLLRSFGIKPVAMLAHSAGETAMAYASGAFGSSSAQRQGAQVAMRLSILRAQLMATTEAQDAGMLALACSSRTALDLLLKKGLDAHLEIAAINGPEAVTLAGPRKVLSLVQKAATESGIQASMLRTNVAAHSRFMEPLAHTFMVKVKALFAEYGLDRDRAQPNDEGIDIFSSTVGGGSFQGSFSPGFWWANTRNVVQFDDCCRALHNRAPGAVLLELAPHPVLGALVEEQAPVSVSLTALRRPKMPSNQLECQESDMYAFLSMIGDLFCRGQHIDIGALFEPGEKVHFTDSSQLPICSFQRTPIRQQLSREALASSQPRRRRLCAKWPGLAVSADLFPDLAEHRVNNVSCIPGAGFLAIVIDSIPGCHELRDVSMKVAMPIPERGEVPSRLEIHTIEGVGSFNLTSKSVTGHDGFLETCHVEGRYTIGTTARLPTVDLREAYRWCPTAVPADALQRMLELLVPQLGDNFRRVFDVFVGENESIASIRVPKQTHALSSLFDPALLDAIIHATIPLTWFPLTAPPTGIYLPKHIARAVLDPDCSFDSDEPLYAHVKFRSWEPEAIVADCKLLDRSGKAIQVLDRLCLQLDRFAHPSLPDLHLGLRWQPLRLAAARPLWPGDSIVASAAYYTELYQLLDHNALWYLSQTTAQLHKDAPIHRHRYQEYILAEKMVQPAPSAKVPIPEAFSALAGVLDRIGPHISDALVDETVGVRELFQDDIMTSMYKLIGSMDRAFEDAVQSLFQAARAALHSGKRVMRVLEVGAGTGQFSCYYGQAWLNRPSDLRCLSAEFVVTDVSSTLAAQALDAMPPELAVKSSVIDLAQPCEGQLEPHTGFDVVVAWDVLHVVADVSTAIRNVRSLLAPGGYLIAIDPDNEAFRLRRPGAIFFNVVMGVFKDWFAFDDGRTHSTMPVPAWRQRLAKGGFQDISIARFEPNHLSHIVISAQASQSDVERRRRDETSEALFYFGPNRETELARWLVDAQEGDDPGRMHRIVVGSTTAQGHAVLGLTRTARRECPDLNLTVVLIDADAGLNIETAIQMALVYAPEPEILVASDYEIKVLRFITIDAPQPWLAAPKRYSTHSIIVDGNARQAVYPCPANLASRGFALVQVSHAIKLGRWILAVGVWRNKSVFCVAQAEESSSANPFTLSIPEEFLVDIEQHADNKVLYLIATEVLKFIVEQASPTSTLNKVAIVSSSAIEELPLSKDKICCDGLLILDVDKSSDPYDDLLEFGPDLVLVLQNTTSLGLCDYLELSGSGEGDVVLFAYSSSNVATVRSSRLVLHPFHSLLASKATKLKEIVESVPRLLNTPPKAPIVPPTPELEGEQWPIFRHGWQERTPLLDGDASYLLVGGCSSMGLHLAHFMYTRGARHIVCTARSTSKEFLAKETTSKSDRNLLRWLEERKDLRFDTVSLDAADSERTGQLCRKYYFSGAFFLPLSLLDKPLREMSSQDFDHVYRAKVYGLEVLIRHLPSAAWLIATSTLSTLSGSKGAANYSAASTYMEALVAQRPRSISLLLSSVSDVGTFARWTVQGKTFSGAKVWQDLACSIEDLLLSIPDALMILQDIDSIEDDATHPTSLFVGRLHLPSLLKVDGAPRHLLAHLMPQLALNPHLQSRSTSHSHSITVRSIVAGHVDIDPHELRGDVALKIYGLDSLAAARLSASIRKHFALDVTQLQLLSDVTLDQLEEQSSRRQKTHQPLDGNGNKGSEDKDDEKDDCIVKLNSVDEGRPLFILHGGGVGLRHFHHWAQGLSLPVYGVRETLFSASLCSANEILAYYANQLRQVQPQGPYRLAAFCLGTLWAPRLVEILKAQGQIVESLIFLDNSPAFFVLPVFLPSLQASLARRHDLHSNAIFGQILAAAAYDIEPAFAPTLLDQLGSALLASDSHSVAPWVQSFYRVMDRQLLYALRLLHSLGCSIDQDGVEHFCQAQLARWLCDTLTLPDGKSIPTLIVTMTKGLLLTSPHSDICEADKRDMAMSHVCSDVTALSLPGSHYGAFGDSESESSEVVKALAQASARHLSKS